MSDEIKRKVASAINTSGYPLELYVATILNKREHVVWHNDYFFDYEAKKARTVDIVAPAFDAQNPDKVFMGNEVIIECKRGPQVAWVFFETDSVILPEYIGQIFDYRKYASGKYNEPNLIWNFDKKLDIHYGKQSEFTKIAQNYQVVRIGEKDLDENVKQPKTKDSIFEAVNQVIKYITHRMTEGEERILKKFFEEGIYPLFNIRYPVVVYDGLLYNGYLQDEKIELEERKHVILEYQFRPSYSIQPQKFYIDIITKNYFEEFIEILEKEQVNIYQHLIKDKEKFVTHSSTIRIPNNRIQKLLGLKSDIVF